MQGRGKLRATTRRPHFGRRPELKNLKLGNFGEKLETDEIDQEGEGSFGVEDRSSTAMEMAAAGAGVREEEGRGRRGYLGGSPAAMAPSGSASSSSEKKGPQLVRYDAQRDQVRLCSSYLNRDTHQWLSGIG